MRSLRYYVMLIVVVGMAMLLAGCGIAIKEIVEESPYHLVEDFSGYELGASPAGWSPTAGPDYIRVVADAGIGSGRAVQFLTNPASDSTTISAPINVPSSANTIEVQHKIKWVKGKNNLYITRDNIHRLHWWMEDDGALFVRTDTSSGKNLGVTLEAGEWYHIKLVANRELGTFSIYLDDMEIPLSENLGFREETDSWDDARVIFSFSHSEGQEKEMYIGEVKVRVID